MGDLSERDVEDILEGVQPPGRDDLAPVVELATWMHVTSEIEPPPAMRDYLFWQIEDGPEVARRSSRRSPAHLGRHRARTRRLVPAALASSARPIVSVGAAAVLLLGVMLAVRAGGPEREPTAVASQPAPGAPPADAATSSTSPATATTAAEASTTTTSSSVPVTATAPDRSPATTVTTGEPPAAAVATAESTAPPDTSLVPSDPPTNGTTPPTTGDRNQGTSDGRPEEPRSRSSSEPTSGSPPLSWWPAFDLSGWPPIEELLGAADERNSQDGKGDRTDDGSHDWDNGDWPG
jgi:hypothetical protein